MFSFSVNKVSIFLYHSRALEALKNFDRCGVLSLPYHYKVAKGGRGAFLSCKYISNPLQPPRLPPLPDLGEKQNMK